ncbi:MAG TPA: glycosyltransferase [Thermodesulfobacteriota bacterium]|nr:glycosyltransferase [Thermodesulfobacteriota bacterium]
MMMLTSETLSQNPPSQLTISVIIPVRDGGPGFRRCLQGVTEAAPASTEIIVVADGDTDGSWHVAEEFGVKVLRNDKPQGPARARNLGARTAQGDVLFFLDADVVIHPDAIVLVEMAFRNDPQLAALFGSYDDEPGEGNFLSQYKNLFHHYVHQISREEASTFWSGCGGVRRQVFVELGGFSETYQKPSIEDIELGYRMKQAGYRIRLSKELHVKHLKRWNIRSLLKSDFFDRALPWTELILRDRSFINDLNLRSSSRLSVVLTYGFLAALVGGYWWSGWFAAAGGLALLLIILGMPVYRFFLQKRGFWFMIGTIPWQWFYFFYSGLAFVIGLVQFFFSRRKSPKVGLSVAP